MHSQQIASSNLLRNQGPKHTLMTRTVGRSDLEQGIVFMKVLLVLGLLVLAETLYAQSPIQIDFKGCGVGDLPSGWTSRDQKQMSKVYSVQAEGERKYLRADACNLSTQICYETKWNINDYPILQWHWRAVIFPTGSNERIKAGNDSVLGVYVLLSGFPFVRAIKYIWSDTLPVGMTLDSPHSSGTKMIVVRSGRALTGTWVAEKRNVLSDYECLFGRKAEHPVAQGIAILTDSDDTSSRAVGDYADISICSLK